MGSKHEVGKGDIRAAQSLYMPLRCIRGFSPCPCWLPLNELSSGRWSFLSFWSREKHNILPISWPSGHIFLWLVSSRRPAVSNAFATMYRTRYSPYHTSRKSISASHTSTYNGTKFPFGAVGRPSSSLMQSITSTSNATPVFDEADPKRFAHTLAMDPRMLAPYHISWSATIDTRTLKISTCTVCLVRRGWNWESKFLPTKLLCWNRHWDVSSTIYVRAYDFQKFNALCISLIYLPSRGFLGLLRGISLPGKSINKVLYLLHRTHAITHVPVFFSYCSQDFDR